MISATADRLSDALADRYRVERELGAGGMATVSDDERLPPARALRGRLPRTQLVIIPGHGHADVVTDTPFGQTVARFYHYVDAARRTR